MSKKRKAARILRRKPTSWLSVIAMVFSLGALFLKVYDEDSEGKVTNPAQIFEAFAELDTDAGAVVRMRGSPLPPLGKPLNARWRTIVQVVDGDTLKLEGGETVRLIGVDAPEASENRKLREDMYKMRIPVRESDLARLGESAAEFTRRAAEGRRCWLEHENNPTDQYGRLLAYVHLDDGASLNELILSEGYGKAYLGLPFKYKKRYIMLQAGASLDRKGLWAEPGAGRRVLAAGMR